MSHEQGTVRSYVIGYLLSLIFTFIPYYLVDSQIITGTTLFITILGYALIQMIIQMTFFLHLGREPKPRWNLLFFASTFTLVLVVVGGSILIINTLHYKMLPEDQVKKLVNDEGIYQIGGKKTGACEQQYNNYQIVIKDKTVTPNFIEANTCDTLTFISEDESPVQIVFGEPDAQTTYAGEIELIVRKNRNKTITLSEEGTFKFRNAQDQDVSGSFSVTTAND